MSLITIRPGVVLRPDAAASFRRYERALGRPADVNRTTSSFAVQENLYRLRQAGKYPYSVANPRTSNHVYRSDSDGGNAWDTDERGPLLDEHGWLATVKGEPWHREYHRDHDQHINDPEPNNQEDDMIINIQGRTGKRRGGAFYIANGVATFLGASISGIPTLDYDAGTALAKRVSGIA